MSEESPFRSGSNDAPRLLPSSEDSEKGLLCSFLNAPREVGGLCAEEGVSSRFFYNVAHQPIFDTLMEMWERNEKIDFIVLGEKLKDKGHLAYIGGSVYLSELLTFLPTTGLAESYITVLRKMKILRDCIEVGMRYATQSYKEVIDVDDHLDEFERKVMEIRPQRRKGIKRMQQLVVQAMGRIEDTYQRRGSITGLETGFRDLDMMTNGLQPTELVVIAARPSMGKTAFAMNMAEHIAVDLKKPIAVFSLEMSDQQLVIRSLCSRARVNLVRVRDGFLSERDFPALQVSASKWAEAPVFLDDTSSISIQEIRAKARRLKAEFNIQAVFVDYLQLVRSTSRRAQERRQTEIDEVSGGLKGLAKELNIPVVALAQLSRKPESRMGETKGRPRLSDLRESGSIEQDADTVGLLVREEYYAETDEERTEAEGKATLIIAKQRNGPVGEVPLTFLKEYTRFETRACSQEEPDQQGQMPL